MHLITSPAAGEPTRVRIRTGPGTEPLTSGISRPQNRKSPAPGSGKFSGIPARAGIHMRNRFCPMSPDAANDYALCF